MSQPDNGQKPAVKVENLSKAFGDFVAVDDISFEVSSGEIFGFLGPNGAGKTTTIKILCGLLAPTSGKAMVAGYDVAADSFKIKEHIGYMSQLFSLYPDLTVEENISFFSGIYALPRNIIPERVKWVLDLAGLSKKRDTMTEDLAGGWKQRLALGCALIHQPKILFLDEPTSGVDPISRRRFWDLIYSFAGEGVTVFVTTHYMDEAEYCNRLALMNQGRIIAMDSPANLKAQHLVGQVWELDCDRPLDAIELLEKNPAVEEIAVFGKALHVIVSDSERDFSAAVDLLAEKQIKVKSLVRIEPTLEDIFVYLTKKEGLGNNAAGEVQP
jgi:ABC-2 type transport system ATP-binding protein